MKRAIEAGDPAGEGDRAAPPGDDDRIETAEWRDAFASVLQVVQAAVQLAADGNAVDVLSVTSWSELARDGQACEAADSIARAARWATSTPST